MIKLASNLSVLGTACLLMSLVACGDNLRPGGDSSDGAPSDGASGTDGSADGSPTDATATDARIPTTPTVLATVPANAALVVPRNTNISAMFSEAMDPATLTPTTFTVTTGTPAVAVAGTRIYGSSEVVFWPTARLAPTTMYTATITTGARSSFSVPMAALHTWSFTTGPDLGPEPPVNLRTAGEYVVLGKSGISMQASTRITGNLGVSPVTSTAITGAALMPDVSRQFSTCAQVTGRVYAPDYASPTPANLTAAVSDMELAFTDAASRAPDVTELGAGSIGGLTLVPGVYKWSSGLLIATNVTLQGGANGVWIFQIAQNLALSPGAMVMLTGGALPKNVFWQVSGNVNVDTTAHLQGVVVAMTEITLRTGARLTGRLLAQTAVVLQADTMVIQPAP